MSIANWAGNPILSISCSAATASASGKLRSINANWIKDEVTPTPVVPFVRPHSPSNCALLANRRHHHRNHRLPNPNRQMKCRSCRNCRPRRSRHHLSRRHLPRSIRPRARRRTTSRDGQRYRCQPTRNRRHRLRRSLLRSACTHPPASKAWAREAHPTLHDPPWAHERVRLAQCACAQRPKAHFRATRPAIAEPPHFPAPAYEVRTASQQGWRCSWMPMKDSHFKRPFSPNRDLFACGGQDHLRAGLRGQEHAGSDVDLIVIVIGDIGFAEVVKLLHTAVWFGSGCFEFRYAFQLLCDCALGQLQVVGRLKIEPILR